MTSARTRRLGLGPVVAVAALLLGACGATAAPAAGPSAAATAPAPALTIPPARDKPLLTLSGKIGHGHRVLIDRAGADTLTRVDLTVLEPFQKQRVAYKGVWLDDLLRAVEAEPSAQTVHLTALDDYVVDLPMADLRSGGVFLAVQNADGTAIPVAEGGPTRLVFRDGTPKSDNSDLWIWSLATIEVR